MIGRTLTHYKVLEEISRGGMGIVYKALELNRGKKRGLSLKNLHEQWRERSCVRTQLERGWRFTNTIR